MYTIAPHLNHWLTTQCQMIGSQSSAVLLRYAEDLSVITAARYNSVSCDSYRVNADDSDNGENIGTDDLPSEIRDLGSEVLEKKRMAMRKTDGNKGYLAYPVYLDDKLWGTIVVLLNNLNPKTLQRTLKLLKWGLTWLPSYTSDELDESKNTDVLLADLADTPKTFDELSQLKLSLGEKLLSEKTLTEMGISAVNILATVFKVARVSVAVVKKNHAELLAISHSARFDARSEPMQHISFAMEESLLYKSAIYYHRDSENDTDAQRHEKASHINLCHFSRAGSVASFLLKDDGNIIAIITIESPPNDTPEINNHSNIESVIEHISPIFVLKIKSDINILFMLKNAATRQIYQLFGANFLTKKIIFGMIFLLLFCLFIPVKYNVKQSAAVESKNKHSISSPYDGYLGVIHAHPGDIVEKGDILAQIKVDDLRLESRKLLNQIQQYRVEYDNALASSNRAQAAIITSLIDQAKIQLELSEKKLKRATLTSPINGVIVSEDISQSLGAPTKQGDVLFEVASINEYRIQLYVKENNIRFVKRLQQGQLNLKGLPDTYIEFEITNITPISSIKDNQNVFLVEAELISNMKSDIKLKLRPGMTGSSSIFIEKRSLGWIIFHDIWYWIRLQFWF